MNFSLNSSLLETLGDFQAHYRLFRKALGHLSEFVDTLGGPWAVGVEIFLAIVLPILLGSWMLGPISRRAGRLKGALRYQLNDFFWLVVQFQLVLGYSVRFVGVEQRFMFVLVLVGTSCGVIALWSGAVRFMSRARVTEVRRRATFVMLILPTTVVYLMVTTFILLVAADSCFGLFDDLYRHRLEDMLLIMSMTRAQLIAGVLLIPPTAWVLRRAANWVVSETGIAASTPAIHAIPAQ